MNSGTSIFGACGVPDRLYAGIIALFVGIAAGLAAINWLGIRMVVKGWRGRATGDGKAQLIGGAFITLAMTSTWILVSSPFFLNQ